MTLERRNLGTAPLRRLLLAMMCAVGVAVTGFAAHAQGDAGVAGFRTLLEQLGLSAVPGRQVLTPLPPQSGADGSLGTFQQQQQVQTLIPSPFSTAERPDYRPSPNAFSPIELIVIGEYCSGKIDPLNERLITANPQFTPLERDYCRRARQAVLQHGYEVFDRQTVGFELKGGVRDDYVLGSGDELIVTFFGQRTGSVRTRVDRNGRVILPDLPPVPAGGVTFGEFRRRLEAQTSSAFIGTEVFVSLGQVRQISVVVAGEVRSPGVQTLSGLSSVVEAIVRAGGIKKTGSLRRVQVQRGTTTSWVDFYDLLFAGGANLNLALFEGDRITVPSLGPTVALAGDVRRPGIYELDERGTAVPFAEVVQLAGGFIRPGANRFFHLTFGAEGADQTIDRRTGDFAVKDGDIVVVQPWQDIQVGTVEIVGHVRLPGRRSLGSFSTLGALLGDRSALRDDPYLLLGVLQTTDPSTGARQFFPVNLQSIIEGRQDYTLRDADRLIVLGSDDIRYIGSDEVQRIITRVPQIDQNGGDDLRGATGAAGPGQRAAFDTQTRPGAAGDRAVQAAVPSPTNAFLLAVTQGGNRQGEADGSKDQTPVAPIACAGLDRLRAIQTVARVGRYANAVRSFTPDRRESEEAPEVRRPKPCPEVYDRYPDLLPFVLEQVAAVTGEVRMPGGYPIVGATPLASLIAVSGNVTREADLTRVEISRYTPDQAAGASDSDRRLYNLAETNVASLAVGPGDVVRFNPVFTDRDVGPVLVSGEVRRPGFYEIRRGERLSQVVARAGGLTDEAYPYGAVFTRESVRRAEQVGLQRAARELNTALTIAAATRNVNPDAILGLSTLSQQLNDARAIGRVVIESDPTVLQVRPELDLVIEPGDRLFIPKRPNSVLVIGDVLNPGAQQFLAGVAADRYIRQAGGFQRSADEDRVFVVFPNGEAQPLSVNFFNFTPTQIPPGSTIVVPKEPTPFDLLTFAKDIGSVVSQLAVTAASLAVIGRN